MKILWWVGEINYNAPDPGRTFVFPPCPATKTETWTPTTFGNFVRLQHDCFTQEQLTEIATNLNSMGFAIVQAQPGCIFVLVNMDKLPK